MLIGTSLIDEIKQHIDELDCIFHVGGIKTIDATDHESDFYLIKKHMREYHYTSINHDELVSIIQGLGIRVLFLPPLDQRSDDGIDNALDGDK
jgi:hypothetical protein